jgi:hypothetical protein
MTEQEQAILENWQSTAEGKADMILHAYKMLATDFAEMAQTREGFGVFKNNLELLVEAHVLIGGYIGWLVASTKRAH